MRAMSDSKMSDSISQPKSKTYEIITKYFDEYFYKTDNLSLIKLMIYTPFGLALVFLRCLVLTSLIITLNMFPKLKNNKRFIHAICWTLGIFTQSEHLEQVSHTKDTVRVYVSNHITCLDFLAMKSVLNELNYVEEKLMNRNISTTDGSDDIISGHLRKMLQYDVPKDIGEDLYAQKQAYPFVFFPEMVGTNGGHGVLKFDQKPFSLSQENMQVGVVPIGLKVVRPVMSMSVNWLGSNDLINIFFTLFTPFTLYKMKFFQEQFPNEHETSEYFADRIQKTIASGLSLVCSNIDHESIRQTWLDYKKSLQEQHEQEEQLNFTNRQSESFSDISRVITQVQNVLPNISNEIVREHVQLTSSNDIDTIITSILDSGVSLESPPVTDFKIVKKSQEIKTLKKTPVKGTFQNYETRKFNLLNDARKRYFAKNPN